MEGPSLYLAVERLAPFIGRQITAVAGNTRIGKERLCNQRLLDIFSCGKHLVLQFENFALRIHFLLYGSYEAIVDGQKVSGDYPKKLLVPRLGLSLNNGQLLLYSCSLKYLETTNARGLYDFSIDIMAATWDSKQALEKIKTYADEEVGDVLLDQTLFAGVGNIIKNEVLFLVKKLPTTPVCRMTMAELAQLIETTRRYCRQFLKWHRRFVLRKHYRIYRKSACPLCKGKVTRVHTGKRRRLSYFCSACQK